MKGAEQGGIGFGGAAHQHGGGGELVVTRCHLRSRQQGYNL